MRAVSHFVAASVQVQCKEILFHSLTKFPPGFTLAMICWEFVVSVLAIDCLFQVSVLSDSDGGWSIGWLEESMF